MAKMTDWNEIYKEYPHAREGHAIELDRMANSDTFLYSGIEEWLRVAIVHNHPGAIEKLLDMLKVYPDCNLTLKQRLALYLLNCDR